LELRGDLARRYHRRVARPVGFIWQLPRTPRHPEPVSVAALVQLKEGEDVVGSWAGMANEIFVPDPQARLGMLLLAVWAAADAPGISAAAPSAPAAPAAPAMPSR
jgi:hypothetical protein